MQLYIEASSISWRNLLNIRKIERVSSNAGEVLYSVSMLFCWLIMIAYSLLWPFTSPWRHSLHHFRWWATDGWELAKILTDSRLDFAGEKPLQVALYTYTVVSE